jgi:hypothetical protein
MEWMGRVRWAVILSAGAVMAAIVGCGGSSASSAATTTPTTVNPVATNVYVVQQPATVAGTVLAFSATASGTVSPTATLTLPATFTGNAVATDNVGKIYVGGVDSSSGPSVLVYAAGASGTATPMRTILGGASNFSTPVALTLDSSGLLYVLGLGTSPSVAVYSSTASGAAAPIRDIAGSLATIGTAQGIATDSSGNIFVTTSNGTVASVLVFNATANGNVAPTRTITAVNGVALNNVEGVASDGAGDIYVVNYPPAGPPGAIVAFAAGASGNATAVKTIGGTATGLVDIGGLALDGAGNLYVVGASSTSAPYGLTVSRFASTATGNAAPANIITSASWTAPGYGQVAAF